MKNSTKVPTESPRKTRKMDRLEKIAIDEIAYARAKANYTEIILLNGDVLTVSKTLKSVEDYLAKSLFLRIHKTYVIAINQLEGYQLHDGAYAKLKLGLQLPISRRRKSEFLSAVRNSKK